MKKRRSKSRRKAQGPIARRWSQLWRYAVTGLLVWIPLIITIWVFWWIVDNLGLGWEALLRGFIGRLNRLGEQTRVLRFLTKIIYIPGLGFLSAMVLFLMTGFLTRYLLGRRFIAYGERLVNRIPLPLIGRLYGAVQQIRDVFTSQRGSKFGRVCVIEYPRKGAYGLAFLTTEEGSVIRGAIGKELHAVFVPTTPNPTSGYLLYLTPDQITELDISVEEAMKIIISGGLYVPPPAEKESGEEGEYF